MGYEVKVCGLQSDGWRVQEVALLWSAAGSVDEGDQPQAQSLEAVYGLRRCRSTRVDNRTGEESEAIL